ncbi:FHA domain-containing protein [Candidatus Amarolinea dominans]|uniref:FHA domain-containing protein n=1 Tax=Candidatus Amarolinea dominans TaxID=3140696 RepID=UPI001D84702D|nr:FHA domain-containing protein [Anaerolineae bacterium]
MDDKNTMKMSNAKTGRQAEESSLEDAPFAHTAKPGADQLTPRVGLTPQSPPAGAEAATMQIGAQAPGATPFVRTAMPGADPLPAGAEAATMQIGAQAPAVAPFARTAMPGNDQPTPRPGQLPAWNAPPPPALPAWNAPPPPAPPAWNAPPPPAAPAWNPPLPPPAPSPAGGRGDAATMMMGARAALAFAWLVVLDGPDRGRIHQLQAEMTNLGRVPGSNDIVVADNAVSSQHLKIRSDVSENGEVQYALIDLASRNGTYVGSKATYREESSRVYRHTLHDGDYLLLGETTLVFKCV